MQGLSYLLSFEAQRLRDTRIGNGQKGRECTRHQIAQFKASNKIPVMKSKTLRAIPRDSAALTWCCARS